MEDIYRLMLKNLVVIIQVIYYSDQTLFPERRSNELTVLPLNID
jgi:hypothetical protein